MEVSSAETRIALLSKGELPAAHRESLPIWNVNGPRPISESRTIGELSVNATASESGVGDLYVTVPQRADALR